MAALRRPRVPGEGPALPPRRGAGVPRGGDANSPPGPSAGMCPLRTGRVRPRRKVLVRRASLRYVRTRGCLSGDGKLASSLKAAIAVHRILVWE